MAAYSKRTIWIPGEKGAHDALVVLFALAVLLLGGCEREAPEETVLFERAETSFALGDYEGARDLYVSFVETHPLSPLAPVARQRMATIDRELDTIMGRRGAPAPLYVSPFAETTAGPPLDEEGVRPVEAPSLPTFDR